MTIKLWWKFEGRYYIKDFIQGIKNLIYYFPIIWKTRDYDHFYILEILKHKLKAQAKYIGERNFYSSAKQDARNMRICVSLIEKVQDEYYACEYMEYFESDYNFIPFDENHSEMVETKVSEDFAPYFKKYPLIYLRASQGEGIFPFDGSDKVIAMNMAHINQDRAHKLLFKILQEHLLTWWN